MNKKILVIGSLNMDMILGVENIPAVGETVLGNSVSCRVGGKRCKSGLYCRQIGRDC